MGFQDTALKFGPYASQFVFEMAFLFRNSEIPGAGLPWESLPWERDELTGNQCSLSTSERLQVGLFTASSAVTRAHTPPAHTPMSSNVGVSGDVVLKQEHSTAWNPWTPRSPSPPCDHLQTKWLLLAFPTWNRWGIMMSQKGSGSCCQHESFSSHLYQLCRFGCSELAFLSAGWVFKSLLAWRSMDLMGIILPAPPTRRGCCGNQRRSYLWNYFVNPLQKIKECDTINSLWRTKIACNLLLIFKTVYISFVFRALMMYTVTQDNWTD